MTGADMPNPQQLGAALQSYDGPVMRAYEPSWRDRLATALMGDSRATPERSNFVSGLVGSRGLGSTGNSVVDFTPAGAVLQGQEAARAGDNKGVALAALGVLPGVGPAERAAMTAERAVEREAPHIIAYHGSPHSFDRFDMSKIGTGEGAQAYGHGLYFADNEGVAKSYRDDLSRKISVDGRPLLDRNRVVGSTGNKSVDDVLLAHGGDVDKAIAENSDWLNPAELEILHGLKGKVSSEVPGSMYQVRINADPEHFLDWDKPLSEQSPVVQEALKRFDTSPSSGFSLKDSVATLEAAKSDPRLAHLVRPNSPVNPQGNSLYEGLANDRGAVDWPVTADAATRQQYRRQGATGASDALREAGIPGIKYLDQGSRSAGEGSRNYVVFDDNLVEILKKYGLVGLLGGGAAMGQIGSQGQQEAPGL